MTLLAPGKYNDADGHRWHVFEDGSMVYDDNDPGNTVYPALFTDTEVPEAYKIVRDFGPFTRVNDTRNKISRAVGSVLFNANNFPERAQVGIWGADMGPLNEKITDAVLKALGEKA